MFCLSLLDNRHRDILSSFIHVNANAWVPFVFFKINQMHVKGKIILACQKSFQILKFNKICFDKTYGEITEFSTV